MKKTSFIISFTALVVIVLALSASKLYAYQTYSVNRDATNCRACHGDFLANPYTGLTDGQNWGDDLMGLHSGTMLANDCNTCHKGLGGGFFPVGIGISTGGTGFQSISCVGCHGRSEDAGHDGISAGLGAGLRQHHWNAGVTACAGCHSDANPSNYTPVGEDVPPPYYFTPDAAHPNKPTNPCNPNGEEDYAGIGEGLDNDGDQLYDQNDPDCGADADDDGIPDDQDNCPQTPNGPSLGTCSPGSGNAGTPCTSDGQCTGCGAGAFCSKAQEDGDSDGVGDVCDNCPDNCNVEQLDADSDGAGDVCDQDPGCGGCAGPACEQECNL